MAFGIVAALALGGAACKSSYHSDMVAICACPYSVPAGASSADFREAAVNLGKCLKQGATTDQAQKVVGAIGGSSTAPVRGKVLRDAAKEAGMDSCPLADACDKVWAEQQAHPTP